MGEQRYRFKRMSDGKTVTFRSGQLYLAGNARSKTGDPLFMPLTSVAGFVNRADGTDEAVMIKPEMFHRVASQQNNSNYAYSFAFGDGESDPRWETSRQDAVRKEKLRMADEYYSGAPLVANRALNVMLAGLPNAALKHTLGEDAADALLAAHDASPGTVLAGTALGLVGTMLMPLPGAGAIAGKLAGGAGAARAANVRNLFGISAAAQQGGKMLAQRAGRGKFVQAMVGTMAATAAAEAPMSMLLASADLVDNNKEWTAEAFLADSGSMFAWGMALGAVGTLPTMGLKHAIGGTMRGGKAALSWGKQALMDAAGSVPGAIAYRGFRGVRSKGTGALIAASAGEAMVRSGSRSAIKHLKRRAADRSVSAAKWVMGDVPETFVKHERKMKKLLKEFDPMVPLTSRELRETAELLAAQADDKFVSDTALTVAASADDIINARRAMPMARTHAERFSRAVDELYDVYPKGVGTYKDTSDILSAGISDIALDINTWGRKGTAGLAKEMQAVAGGMHKANPANALREALKLRKRIELEAGLSAPRIKKMFDGVLDQATRGKGDVVGTLRRLDTAQWNARQALDLAEDVSNPAKLKTSKRVLKFAKRLDDVKNQLDNLPKGFVSKESKEAYQAVAKEWADPARLNGAQRIADMNELRFNLANKDPWATTMKAAQGHPNFTAEALLEAKVDMAITTKRRTAQALKYLINHGAPSRQAAIFSGVYQYRQMGSYDERLKAYEAHRQALLQHASGPESMIQALGEATKNIAAVDQELATGYAYKAAQGAAYLIQHMPKSREGLPPSSAEMESWLERVGAFRDPISVIYSAADGSVMPEAVDTIRSTFPAMYVEMMLDVSDFIHERGHELKFHQLLGLDTFMGGALGIAEGANPYRPPTPQTKEQAMVSGGFGPQRMQQLSAVTQTPAQKVGGL